MKPIIRSRINTASCRALVAQLAEQDADNLKTASSRGNPNPATMAELVARSSQYREEEARYLRAAKVCGSPMLCVRR